MNFIKLLFAAAFLTCLATAARAQATCTLTVDKAPELRGLRLGMTLGEIKSLAPDIKVNDQGFGQTYTSLSGEQLKADATRFKGINSISFSLVDERVVGFSIDYGDSVRWESTSQFVSKVSEALRLPAAWEGDDTKTMSCVGFKIVARPNNIGVGMSNAYDIVQRRRAEDAERRRQGFKP